MDLEEKVRDEVRIQIREEGEGDKQPEENHSKQTSSIVKSEFKQFDTINDSFFTDHQYYYRRHKNFSQARYERISRECDILKEGLPDSIFVRANKQKPDLLRAVIIGPEGTPYHDGLFFFDIQFPAKYPAVPPKFGSNRIIQLWDLFILHPSARWNPSTSTLLESLLSIRRSQIFSGEVVSYIDEMNTLTDKELVYKFNWRTMVDELTKPPKYFENFVARHFHDRAEQILTTSKAYISKRVNTADDPVTKAKARFYQEEFDMMERRYHKLVDAFQKNGSILPELSKLDIEFHGERSCSKGMEIFECALLFVLLIGSIVALCFAIKDIVSNWGH